jgi:diacylglycerol kinase (ATP)
MRAVVIEGTGERRRELTRLRAAGLEFSEENPAAAVVLGGDGTIHHALPRLLALDVPVLFVPCGSGNDLARALGLHSVDIAVILAEEFIGGRARVANIDIGVIRDAAGKETPFACVGGTGLDAVVGERANRMPRWLRRNGGYLLGAAAAIVSPPRLRVSVTHDDQTLDEEVCLFCFANTQTFGGGMRIAPNAALDDGKLDCVFARSMGILRLLRLATSLLRATHLRHPEVGSFRCERLSISSTPETFVYADGEPVCRTPVEVSVVPRALKAIVP